MMTGPMRCKTCKVCNQEKTIRNFYKHPTTLDGYFHECRECHKKNVSENKSLKKEYYNAKQRLRQNAPEAKAKRAAYRARPEVKAMLHEAYKFRRVKLETIGNKA